MWLELKKWAAVQPQAVALDDGRQCVRYGELQAEIEALATTFKMHRLRTVAWMLDNGVPWALVDLAAARAGICAVPLPTFFSTAQLRHICAQVRPDAVIIDGDTPRDILLEDSRLLGRPFDGIRLFAPADPADGQAPPPGVAKITFTSGSTGTPKGVCLQHATMMTVVDSLLQAVNSSPADRHLCMMPLSTLLENLAGLYVGLSAGAAIHLPSLSTLGFSGIRLAQPERLGAALAAEMTTAITTPALLQAVVDGGAAAELQPAYPALRFLAVGGATVPTTLLQAAADAGLPVFQGYGMSECASVISLNTPASNRLGSVGKPLPHLRVRIENGEIVVGRHVFSGYLGESSKHEGPWFTGDCGELDDDGYLYVSGRRRSLLITSNGRNISPDWVRAALERHADVLRAEVRGDGEAALSAVVCGHSRAAVAAAVATVNTELPEYARISRYDYQQGDTLCH
jgi:long-subunit acyl-CoA synthetase (AMP-forming)